MNKMVKIIRNVLIVIMPFCIVYYVYLTAFNSNVIDRAWVWIALSVLILFDLIIGRSKNKRMIFVWGTFNFTCLAILVFSILLIWNMGKSTYTGDENTIMIFAGGFQKNGELSTMALKRVKLGISLNHDDCRYIVSGGLAANNKTEAELIRQMLIKHNIENSRIIIDKAAKDTHQNVENCRRYIGDSDELVVVSSRFHIFRIKMLFAKAGLRDIHVIGAGSDMILLPHNYVREICSILRDTCRGWTDWPVI